ncbi:alcohol dehydrogenase catalytic domain-containing protein [Streptomyces griseoviridis]|uniref:Alcohol dehydrogenase n=3 Tax=Streptomyces TaxID=1883 RepID=A0A918LIB7_STRGD|nr:MULTISPECIES: alcohol dehydrogenase catalytic domain-containing protein [Streptomyces]MDP9680300.1 alcohol dehydrogenase [Streptomyces griseoviridis]GGS55605.1 alcohol dehydrogenase [Streptomyces niveoruber]GGT09607.1 alcohol dehydrogenase [Streptomyces griseoviridis]GGU53030.1 alcohol dehydrogenase [Streptomyces daghestanicus]GHI28278.1 alcohol dehydrogenase [Streptomyces daghestanicus]
MSSVRAVLVDQPAGALRTGRRDVPDPGPFEVRVTVEACGVCHTDSLMVEGLVPGLAHPVTPGHEIAGRIDAVGAYATGWQAGDRVAVGWFGGHCGHCVPCRRGDFIHCTELKVPGWAYPGGYGEALNVPANALARIPDGISAVDAAPLACAGVTTFNALRRSGAGPGDLVAVLGLGGLGHLGVQFAVRMGFETVVIARGAEKRALAGELGAHHYVDSTAEEMSPALQALGGARAVLATAGDSETMSAAVDGLGPDGELVVLGVDPEPMRISPLQLIDLSKRISGLPSGTAADIEDTLRFAALTGVRPHVEEMPLERAADAYARMMDNRARFRVVLTTGA